MEPQKQGNSPGPETEVVEQGWANYGPREHAVLESILCGPRTLFETLPFGNKYDKGIDKAQKQRRP